MNIAAIDIETYRKQLVSTYRDLPPQEQALLRLFAIIYQPVGRDKFLACLHATGRREKNGNYTSKTIKPVIDRFLARDLLQHESGNGVQIHPLLAEMATRDALQQPGEFEMAVEAVGKVLPIGSSWQREARYFSSVDQLLREVRIGIYRGDVAFVYKQLEDYAAYNRGRAFSLIEALHAICGNPFDADWLRTLPPALYEVGLRSQLLPSLLELTPAAAPFRVLVEDCNSERATDSLRLLLIEQSLLRGDLAAAVEVLGQLSSAAQAAAEPYLGWITLLQGDVTRAIAHFGVGLKAMRKATGKRQAFFDGMAGIFCVFALLKDGSAERLREADGYTTQMVRQPQHLLEPVYALLKSLIAVRQGTLAAKEPLVRRATAALEEGHAIESLTAALCLYWIESDADRQNLASWLELLAQLATRAGYSWIAEEAATILARLQPEQTPVSHRSFVPIADAIQPQESWELCLHALVQLQPQQGGTAVQIQSAQRLAWFVTYHGGECRLVPREQKLGTGGWSKGRNVALKRLKHEAEALGYLSEQDLSACRHIEVYSEAYYGPVSYVVNPRAVVELVGHPLVFWEDTATQIEVVRGEPALVVRPGKSGRLVLEFSPPLPEGQDLVVLKETPTRLKVTQIGPEQRRVAEILGSRQSLEVPEAARERVMAAINAVSRMVTVHSDIGSDQDIEAVEADGTPHFHLLPAGEGLKVALLVRPFGTAGPYFRPGSSGETVIAEIDSRRLQTRRDLKEEVRRSEAAVALCPTLSGGVEAEGEWRIEAPEDCLELLAELQALESTVVIEWPEGEKFRIAHKVGSGQFRVALRTQRDWFAVEGELNLDENLTLDMQQLLALVERTPGRFVPLENGQFLALSAEFRRRLDALRAYTDHHGRGLRVNPLAVGALEAVLDGVGTLEADDRWQAQVERFRTAQAYEPQVPSTLQAELRAYQQEGFRWLARLAHWGAGACLADDMGLGKTLQALAVILTRAPGGPTLVIAPTSVCANWASEAARFAPTLRVSQLGGGERRKRVEALQGFDLLLVSYGLLQQEDVAELLAGVQWQTIVLDEAQAIKNMATRRSQAAMALQGGFKLITTGTPVENHLGELWNLFRFITPGLLGSLEHFNRRFAGPIERGEDKQARARLKQLIQPFLLRRMKSQVLEELPSRTEILLQVELSAEEMAFYETLRREAVAQLTDSEASPGQKHVQVLAAIMKLRRACCNVRMVVPDLPLPSAKLKLFSELLDELLENRHKALVFSQFVQHLQIIRAHLDARQIRYQYLDGSTPAAERKKRVDAFQSGEGDVFLISLKAGGTGLNLTAADYVIHMDPWWNPAVEDQASDRAHRIGQQRPVTIYRLVAQHTIEDKIVALHRHKRALADSLLEGTDAGGRLSTEELLQLMSD